MAAKKKSNKTGKINTTAPPTAADLAAEFGVTVQKPLDSDTIWRMRKALPGYVAVLDDAAELLTDEGDTLQIKGIEPADLLGAREEQKYLAQREAVLYAVYRSVYEQRLQVDDRAMRMLDKIARRLNALAEDDPTLKARWKILLDFLGTFRGGAPQKPAADKAAADKAAADKPAADKPAADKAAADKPA